MSIIMDDDKKDNSQNQFHIVNLFLCIVFF